MADLKKFVEKNRGFIKITNYEITNIIKERGLGINIEYLRRYIQSTLGRKITEKTEKADFYKLIPDLEDTIISILKKDVDNNYVLIFDDLDIGYYKKSKSQIQALSALIRITKDYNNELFGRNGLSSKIIVLLRDDIYKHLRFNADTAKIFDSYAVELNWYEDVFRLTEEKLKLKQFINKRIAKNFEKFNMDYNQSNPWESFINESEFRPRKKAVNVKSSFKYILDHTFYRPRDLILFFKGINDYSFNLPLSRDNINFLTGKYANRMMQEIQNELTAVFDEHEITQILKVLKNIMPCSKKGSSYITYTVLLEALKENGFTENAEDVIDELFDYSLIGNLNPETKNVRFKFREKECGVCKIDTKEKIILHFMLRVYFNDKRIGDYL